MVHSSLSAMGYVVNGPNDVIDAILKMIGPEGTLMMPSHSGDKSDPEGWKNPPVPMEWFDLIRDAMMVFDPKTTPIRGRGKIAETFMLYDDIYRSSHPIASIIAKGKRAKEFTLHHPLHESEGLGSPIGNLYQNEGCVLLIGVDLSSNTGFHLAEYIADVSYLRNNNVKVVVSKSGENRYVKLEKYPISSKDFPRIEPDLLQNNLMASHPIHGSKIRFMKLKPVIDFIVRRLHKNPSYLFNHTT